MSGKSVRKKRIFTIGHSDHSMDAFLSILERSSVRLVVDIRSNPASTRFPRFERHALSKTLEEHGLAYRWFRSLGGIQTATLGEKQHTALKNEADCRYVAYLNTPNYHENCLELIGLAASAVVAIMGAEQDPEHCYRRFLSDKLMHMGVRVTHILGANESREHVFHNDLKIEKNRLVYRARQLSLV